MCIVFLLLALSGFTQSKVVYIRVQEANASVSFDSYMSITYPDQSSKTIVLARVKNAERVEANGKIIHKEITTLINDGYELNSCSVGGDVGATTTIFVFIKKN